MCNNNKQNLCAMRYNFPTKSLNSKPIQNKIIKKKFV